MSQFSLGFLFLFFLVLALVWASLMSQFSLFFLVLFFLVLFLFFSVLVWGSLMSQFYLLFFGFGFGFVGKAICRLDAL